MRKWLLANGGPLALVVVGLTVSGRTSVTYGLILVAVGIVWWAGGLVYPHLPWEIRRKSRPAAIYARGMQVRDGARGYANMSSPHVPGTEDWGARAWRGEADRWLSEAQPTYAELFRSCDSRRWAHMPPQQTHLLVLAEDDQQLLILDAAIQRERGLPSESIEELGRGILRIRLDARLREGSRILDVLKYEQQSSSSDQPVIGHARAWVNQTARELNERDPARLQEFDTSEFPDFTLQTLEVGVEARLKQLAAIRQTL
jgi:hypothetical protein